MVTSFGAAAAVFDLANACVRQIASIRELNLRPTALLPSRSRSPNTSPTVRVTAQIWNGRDARAQRRESRNPLDLLVGFVPVMGWRRPMAAPGVDLAGLFVRIRLACVSG
jgi:hypothetical protein